MAFLVNVRIRKRIWKPPYARMAKEKIPRVVWMTNGSWPSIPGRGPTEQKDSRAFMNVLGIFCLTDGMRGDSQLFKDDTIPYENVSRTASRASPWFSLVSISSCCSLE